MSSTTPPTYPLRDALYVWQSKPDQGGRRVPATQSSQETGAKDAWTPYYTERKQTPHLRLFTQTKHPFDPLKTLGFLSSTKNAGRGKPSPVCANHEYEVATVAPGVVRGSVKTPQKENRAVLDTKCSIANEVPTKGLGTSFSYLCLDEFHALKAIRAKLRRPNHDVRSIIGAPFLQVLASILLALRSIAFNSVMQGSNGSKEVTGSKGLKGQHNFLLDRRRKETSPARGKGGFRNSPLRLWSALGIPMSLLCSLTTAVMLLLVQPIEALPELRESIMQGREPCFHYTPGKNLFQMNCSVLHWQGSGYGHETFITLSSNEIFDGGGTNRYIDLSGITHFEGLFTIDNAQVSSFAEAPLIRNVHVKDGTVQVAAGFIVRKQQKYFIVESCSSTGGITNSQAGGICGWGSGQNNGEIKIMSSYSTGRIIGDQAGGITGEQVGYNGGFANITHCYSTGNIDGDHAGGICGDNAGFTDGQVYITHSYSTGDIISGADGSGGIVGHSAGHDNGYVYIEECYSTGEISADDSGGICGSYSALFDGEVHITDCYTRGNIHGQYAGGITGAWTGGCCGLNDDVGDDYGDVYITNAYASGIVKHIDAGGIIGNIRDDFQGHTIRVQYSVYNNNTDQGKIIGQDNGNPPDETGNSGDLTKIQGQLYHYDGVQQWDNDTWVTPGSNSLPILRFQLLDPELSPKPTPTPSATPSPSKPGPDLRDSIIKGDEPCFHYTLHQKLFQMNCSVLHWQSHGYGPKTFITLSSNEIFDGGDMTENDKPYIDLSGLKDFEGLFAINDSVTTFGRAPLIRNLHVRDGTVAEEGGFIVQREQQFFMIDSCSSTGDITNPRAGGICGAWSGLRGEVTILNSYSTGKILGPYSGGITGTGVGQRDGIANITSCHSTGNIEGFAAGGICGDDSGRFDGRVHIAQCYSTGNLVADATTSGGIVGQQAGLERGYIHIQECYSTGQISADKSGGICGSWAAEKEGKVHITDCYSRGDIDGQYSGGITGWNTGGTGTSTDSYGDVYINNTYASGIVRHTEASGIIGDINSDFQGHTIHVKYSVYNHNEGNVTGEDDGNHLEETGNSGDLEDIRGQLYHYKGIQRWDDDAWVINGTGTLPVLRFQIPRGSPNPTPSMTPTSTASPSTSITPTPKEVVRDLRESIIQGKEPCFHYTPGKRLVRMNCSVLHWQNHGYAADTYISLSANEVFDGGSPVDGTKPYIDLSGIIDFLGLFAIRDAEVRAFAEAPLIRNTHFKHGTTATKSGFIVQEGQRYFIVDSCSSTGDITNWFSGGICGYRCGTGGKIKIVNSHAAGRILGIQAGGITGAELAYDRGIAHIEQCYFMGSFEGAGSGGICGHRAGYTQGQVYVSQCYSIGAIFTGHSIGGIVGSEAGSRGYLEIRECYSTGKIGALSSGGITGNSAGNRDGEVHITNCHTRGDVTRRHAGGIAGADVGGSGFTTGRVYLNNSYASGALLDEEAGGILGSIHHTLSGDVQVQFSVYNGDRIVGKDDGNHMNNASSIGNSGDVETIQGKLYHYQGSQVWSRDVWAIHWTDTLPILRFQVPPTPTPTASRSVTPSSTRTPTVSPSMTPTPTVTPSGSSTQTTSSSRTASPSVTMTRTVTSSSTGTRTATETPTKTATLSATASRTETPTATSSSTETPSASMTQTATETPTSAATMSATNTRTETPTGSITMTATSSSTRTVTPTTTSSKTETPTSSTTPTATSSTTTTATPTPTPTWTATPTVTVTSSATGTLTMSSSPSSSSSSTATSSTTSTPSKTSSPSSTPTVTATGSASGTVTPTPGKATPSPRVIASVTPDKMTIETGRTATSANDSTIRSRSVLLTFSADVYEYSWSTSTDLKGVD